jgi:hypothetical protein
MKTLAGHGYKPKNAIRRWKRNRKQDRVRDENQRHWDYHLPDELARAVCRAKEYDSYIKLGPCGLRCSIFLEFVRDGKKVAVVGVCNADLDTGLMQVTNYDNDSRDFPPGSIGALNGMQYETIEVTPEWTADDFLRYGEETDEPVDEHDHVRATK